MISFRTLTPSKEAKRFALLDPDSKRYYIGYEDYTSYRVSQAKIYNLEYLVQELDSLHDKDVVVLLLPQIQWRDPEATQKKEQMLEKLKYQEDKAFCSGTSFGLAYLVSDGFLPETVLGRDAEKHKQSYPETKFSDDIQELILKEIIEHKAKVDWVDENTMQTLSTETVREKHNPEAVPEPVEEEHIPEYSWMPIEPAIDQPIFHSQIEGIPLLRDFILECFGSEFYDIPIQRQGLFEDGELRASCTQLDVSTLKIKTIVDGFAALRDLVQPSVRFRSYRNNNPDWDPILRKFNLTLELDVRPDGIFFVVGVVGRDAQLESMRYSKLTIRKLVSEWRGKNRETIDAKMYRENEWWDNKVIKTKQPDSNTNLIYVCYYPKSEVIKVGRTADWKKRERTYFRNNGNIPETKGVMRLCYHFETPTTGDELVDKFILFCAETKLINLAKYKMDLVDGNEFFKGLPVLDFCKLVRDTFESATIADILQARSKNQLKQFCRKDGQRATELEERLLELRRKQS